MISFIGRFSRKLVIIEIPSQIAAVNGDHAPTDDAVPSGDKSTATNSFAGII